MGMDFGTAVKWGFRFAVLISFFLFGLSAFLAWLRKRRDPDAKETQTEADLQGCGGCIAIFSVKVVMVLAIGSLLYSFGRWLFSN